MKQENYLRLGLLGLALLLLRKSNTPGIGATQELKEPETTNQILVEKFITKVLNNETTKDKIKIYLPTNTINVIKRQCNINISTIYLTRKYLKHIINRHYGKHEKDNKQLGLTTEDLFNIPQIIKYGIIEQDINSKSPDLLALKFTYRIIKEGRICTQKVIALEIRQNTDYSFEIASVYIKKGEY